MKYETPFGDVKLEIAEDGIIVESEIPFLEYKQKFYDLHEARKVFDQIKQRVIEILEKMKKVASSEDTILKKKVRTLIEYGFRKILLYGPTGTGKTFTTISTIAELREQGKIDDFIVFTFSSGMEDIDILGKYIIQETGAMKFEPSKLLKFLEINKDKKVAIVFDEFNRASSKTLNILIPMLDGRDRKVIIENFIKGTSLEIPEENVIFIFTANFGSVYTGTFQLDEAILNRVDIALFVDYQEDLENKIISSITDEEKRRFVRKIRDFFREAYKKGVIHPFTTRDLKNLVKLIQPLKKLDDDDVIFNAIEPIVFKLVKVDSFGYPDEEFLEDVKKFIRKYIGEDYEDEEYE